jgi:signal transduction histidine kinase
VFRSEREAAVSLTAAARSHSLSAPLALTEAQGRERVLSSARLAIAVCCFIGVHFQFGMAGHYTRTAHVLLLAYLLHSLLAAILARVYRDCAPGFLLFIHSTDVLWPALISLFTGGPSSPYFFLFVFALFGAAYRWGLNETLATASASVGVFLFEGELVTSHLGARLHLLAGTFDLAIFMLQGMGLLTAGVLLGYLAERERTLRSRTLEIGRLIQRASPEASIKENLEEVLRAVLTLFDAHCVEAALSDESSGRAYVCEVRSRDSAGAEKFRIIELGRSERQRYFFATPGHSWYLRESSKGGTYRLLALDSKGRRVAGGLGSVPETFFSERRFRSVLAVSFMVGRDWNGRVYLTDLPNSRDLESDLRFLQSLVGEVAPAVHSVYQLRALRSRARAIERARVGRDLHDGVIQSLITLEMQVDALRRQAAGVSEDAAEKLAQVRSLLRQEVMNLRELMQRLSLDDLEPRHLLACVADTVERFQRETGIRAEFHSEVDTVALPSRAATEVAQIVHEALANVRKHSGAQNVHVRLGMEKDSWTLVVEDDGRGFEFSGRLTQSELDFARRGPRVIRERVRSLKGQLAIESQPGHGARLEVRFAGKAYG